jgi:hypothetical protein
MSSEQSRIALAILFISVPLIVSLIGHGEEKVPDPPRIAMCAPLAVVPGTTTRVVVRAWGFDEATEVHSSVEKVTVKLLSVANADIPNKQDAKQIGDRQVELEVTVAADVAPGVTMLTIVTQNGTTKPHPLLIGGEFPIALDTEPNDGFRQAQPIQLPQIIDGQIHGDRNVDVFSFDVTGETNLVIEVEARRRGSGLDSLLTLYDARGNVIAVNDDHTGNDDHTVNDDTTDSRIEQTVAAGRYLISLQDAHDHGGPAHPYRLILRHATPIAESVTR